jgi:hypothetical protein
MCSNSTLARALHLTLSLSLREALQPPSPSPAHLPRSLRACPSSTCGSIALAAMTLAAWQRRGRWGAAALDTLAAHAALPHDLPQLSGV